MQTVILAGGSGRRVFPLAAVKPKPMFKILGKPLIQRVIETLKEAGLKDFIVVIGSNGKQIKDYLADGKDFGVKIEYALQKKPLGMANALVAAKDLVEDNFFVVNADDVFESSLIKEMLKQFQKGDAEIVLSCKPVKETWKFGIIQIKNNKVTKLVEKPPKGMEPSNLAVIGVYLMTKKIFNYFKKIPVSDHQYEDAIQKFIEDKNMVTAVSYEGFFASYKYPWDLFTINAHLMDTLMKGKLIEDYVEISKNANVEGKVWIRRGTKIFGGAYLKGPCYIGSNSIIGNNALVRDYSSIGDNCVVGFSSEIKNSLIGDNCWFHMNYIGDSIISDNCLFGAGAITANFRFDEKNVKVTVEDEKVDSGTNKLGVIMGDFCKVGINASLLPGVKIGPNSIVGAGVCLQEDLEPNKMIFLDKKCYVKKENKLK
ncbi:MAG: sugar phosphate nucleotidyltransferase [Candidatus Bathyarchaeota archaeon]|nr:sugar phosphate nucleotidyltransferase [Candidatus Bathyarchaeota archaeon]MDI6805830.1 sugar phosphate nucleotidyltransferase [Candidatus Bathyarchaeia archaeon]